VSSTSGIVEAATGAYAVTGVPADEEFSCWGVHTGTGEEFYDRTLAARPVTAADAAAWREAGSPATVTVWGGDHWQTAPTTATAWQPDHSDPSGGGYFAGGMTVQQLQNLPTDPATLSNMFFSKAALEKEGIPSDAPPGSGLLPVSGFLGAAPLPPPVRAGLIKAMAAQPGVAALGPFTDALGRPGIALATADQSTAITAQYGTPAADQGTYSSRVVVILDPTTGALLTQEDVLTKPGGEFAHQQPGFVLDFLAYSNQGWVNTMPAGPPAQPPAR